jgi:hypothetical protein
MSFRARPIKSPQDLVEIHAIWQLKYRYMRAIDTLDWNLIDSCFADDASVWYSGGTIRCEGRKEIVEFFRNNLGQTHYSSHIALHPELSLTSERTAEGTWRFQDTVYTIRSDAPDPIGHGVQRGQRAEGAGIYYDRYAKVRNNWLIKSTGFIRLYEYWTSPGYACTDDFAFRGDGLKFCPARGVK